MTRRIDADKLKKKAFTLDEETGLIGRDVVTVEEIDNTPTVEPFAEVHFETFREYERPHGEWIEGYCNYCGGSSLCDGWGRDVESRFCPHCGADMRGKEE